MRVLRTLQFELPSRVSHGHHRLISLGAHALQLLERAQRGRQIGRELCLSRMGALGTLEGGFHRTRELLGAHLGCLGARLGGLARGNLRLCSCVSYVTLADGGIRLVHRELDLLLSQLASTRFLRELGLRDLDAILVRRHALIALGVAARAARRQRADARRRVSARTC